jgi:hypothetical protein
MLRDVRGDGCCSNVYLTLIQQERKITVLGLIKGV